MKKNNHYLYCLAAPIFLEEVVRALNAIIAIIFLVILLDFFISLVKFYLNKTQRSKLETRKRMRTVILWMSTLFFLIFSGFLIQTFLDYGYYVFFLRLGLAMCFNFCLGIILKLYKFKIIYLILIVSLAGVLFSAYYYISVEHHNRDMEIESEYYYDESCVDPSGGFGCFGMPTGGCDENYWY